MLAPVCASLRQFPAIALRLCASPPLLGDWRSGAGAPLLEIKIFNNPC